MARWVPYLWDSFFTESIRCDVRESITKMPFGWKNVLFMPNFSQPIKHNVLSIQLLTFALMNTSKGKFPWDNVFHLKISIGFNFWPSPAQVHRYTSKISFFIACDSYGNRLLSSFVHCPFGQTIKTQNFIHGNDLAVITRFSSIAFLTNCKNPDIFSA